MAELALSWRAANLSLRAAEARLALRRELRTTALDALHAGIDATQGEAAVVRALPALLREPPFNGSAAIPVIAWGKAALPMAHAALRVLGDRCAGGLIVTKDGHDEALTMLGPLRVLTAAHPIPDQRSARSGEAVLEFPRSIAGDAPILFLGSGGGSSLLACPDEGVSIDELAVTSRLLLTSGANIREMNVVRKHLSRVHGGRLAARLGLRPSLSLLISDVPGDDPSDIGSGPMAADSSTFSDALEILGRRVGWDSVPASVRASLESGTRGERPETPGPDELHWPLHRNVVIASNADALAAAARLLHERGWSVEIAAPDQDCAEEAARGLVAGALRRMMRGSERSAILRGGEASVVVTGLAQGGRNQHLAAVAAREMDAAATRGLLADVEIVVASLATDGQDGVADVAGGIVDASTWSRAIETLGPSTPPDALLAECRAREILTAADALVPGVPTGTNVMDLQVALVARLGESGADTRELRA